METQKTQTIQKETLEEKVVKAQLYVPLTEHSHAPLERWYFRMRCGYMLSHYYVTFVDNINSLDMAMLMNWLSTRKYVVRHPHIMLRKRDVTR